MMNLEELSKLVLLVAVLQIAFRATLFAVSGGVSGVNLSSVGLSVALVAAVSPAIAAAPYWMVERYAKERAVRTAIMAITEGEETVLRKIIIQGETRQDELRGQAGFSKSKLSALVNNPVEKNAVEKTRKGRTNLLKPGEEFR